MNHVKVFFYSFLLGICLNSLGNAQDIAESTVDKRQFFSSTSLYYSIICENLNFNEIVSLNRVCRLTNRKLIPSKISDRMNTVVESKQRKIDTLTKSLNVIKSRNPKFLPLRDYSRLYLDERKENQKLLVKNDGLSSQNHSLSLEIKSLNSLNGQLVSQNLILETENRRLISVDKDLVKYNEKLVRENFILKGFLCTIVLTVGLNWLFKKYVQPKIKEKIENYIKSKGNRLLEKKIDVFSSIPTFAVDIIFFALGTWYIFSDRKTT